MDWINWKDELFEQLFNCYGEESEYPEWLKFMVDEADAEIKELTGEQHRTEIGESTLDVVIGCDIDQFVSSVMHYIVRVALNHPDAGKVAEEQEDEDVTGFKSELERCTFLLDGTLAQFKNVTDSERKLRDTMIMMVTEYEHGTVDIEDVHEDLTVEMMVNLFDDLLLTQLMVNREITK